MKRIITMTTVALALAQGALTAEDAKKAAPQPTTEQISETMGHMVGRLILMAKDKGIPVKEDSVIQGMKDALQKKTPPLTDEQYQEAMAHLVQASMEKTATKNLQEAEEYLKKNTSATGVKEIVPGKLQYLIVKSGDGTDLVTEISTPKIKYSGKFIDGTVFDSSDESGPIALPLNHTIPGFSKGMSGMKKGEIRRLFIHPEMGYGTEGDLPPNSLLIFDIEVVEPNSAPAAKE